VSEISFTQSGVSTPQCNMLSMHRGVQSSPRTVCPAHTGHRMASATTATIAAWSAQFPGVPERRCTCNVFAARRLQPVQHPQGHHMAGAHAVICVSPPQSCRCYARQHRWSHVSMSDPPAPVAAICPRHHPALLLQLGASATNRHGSTGCQGGVTRAAGHTWLLQLL
jgi:hypothetical protein